LAAPSLIVLYKPTLVQFAENTAKRRRTPLGVIDNRRPNAIQIPELPGFDFGRVNMRFVLATESVDPDKFPASFRTGVDLEQSDKLLPQNSNPEFLVQLTSSASVVGFAGAEVTRGAGVVAARESVLGGRALLDKEFTLGIEKQNVDSTMLQAALVNFTARSMTDDFITVVDNVENLVGSLHGFMEAQSWQKESPPRVRGASCFVVLNSVRT
jgi:hypothetical protein